MKFSFASLTFVFFSISWIFTPQSHARALDLLSITTTLKPLRGQTYYLGLELSPSGRVLGMYYKNTFRVPNPCTGVTPAEVDHFSLEQLKSPQLMISSLKLPADCANPVVYQVARMQLMGKLLTLSYQADVRSGHWRSQTFRLECDSKMECRVTEMETGQVITHLTAVAHKLGWIVETGIDHLEAD